MIKLISYTISLLFGFNYDIPLVVAFVQREMEMIRSTVVHPCERDRKKTSIPFRRIGCIMAQRTKFEGTEIPILMEHENLTTDNSNTSTSGLFRGDESLDLSTMVDDEMSSVVSGQHQKMNEGYVLAKKEEPGDREEIIRKIKEFQASVARDDPSFPLDTILSRTLDTIEDIFIHVRRIPYDYGWIKDDDLAKTKRETVVVLGSGWAAHAYLKIADTFQQRIIVVSPSNHFVFTPMLASASVGTVEYRSMTEAVRAANPMIENYLEGTATDIDVNEKTITVELKSILDLTSNLDEIQPKIPSPLTISYDKLIVAVGCQVADSMIPGAKKYALRLKSCEDARRLRNAIGESFEYASRPDVKDHERKRQYYVESKGLSRQVERSRRVTFCIVGGGPTGVELAGELADFVKDICKPRVGAYPDLADYVKIVLIHGGSLLVPQFDVDLTQSALKALKKQGVEVRLNTRVEEVGEGYIKLTSKDSGKIEKLPCGLCVWAAGTEPVPFVTRLLDQLPESAKGIGGKILVDQWLRCPMYDTKLLGSILIMGDAAAFRDVYGQNTNSYLPQTAQVAAQQGAFVARLIDREYDLTQTPPVLQTNNVNMKSWLNLRGLEKADGCKFTTLCLFFMDSFDETSILVI
jgi:NADH:ubiquinone reductase (H+-translocating)